MLTIEELKALPVGEWIWVKVIDKDEYHCWKCIDEGGLYYYIQDTGKYGLSCSVHFIFGYDLLFKDYGTKWLAYKNKEEAEGKSITLPYLLCTSSKFACVIWREDGKVHKTHTFPIDEAKGVLEEKRKIQWKDLRIE